MRPEASQAALERSYKVDAHRDWKLTLPRDRMEALIAAREYPEVAQLATRVEARVKHSMLFSFEKMAREHFFFKPMVTRRAAELYGFIGISGYVSG